MRLVYGGYGHNPSGKQYVYWAGDNYRTGQNVVAPVTNKFNGKTYNTMFTIMRTSADTSPMAQNESERLENAGINIKTIGGRDVLSLPSGSDYSSAQSWRESSLEQYQTERAERVKSYGLMQDSSSVRNSLLGI